MIQLHGNQVRLRDWKLDDAKDYIYWLQPGQFWQNFDGPYYPRIPKARVVQQFQNLSRKIKAQMLESPRKNLAIVDKATDQLLGHVGWYWESQETNWLSAGIAIFDPDNWRTGKGYEAFGLWTDYLFQAMPRIVRVDLRTWSGNQGMMKLAEKLGYTQEARFRKARIVEGQYYDSIGYGVLREEWAEMYPQGFEKALTEKEHK